MTSVIGTPFNRDISFVIRILKDHVLYYYAILPLILTKYLRTRCHNESFILFWSIISIRIMRILIRTPWMHEKYPFSCHRDRQKECNITKVLEFYRQSTKFHVVFIRLRTFFNYAYKVVTPNANTRVVHKNYAHSPITVLKNLFNLSHQTL